MARLTLRTLLAYIDDTLEPDLARELGKKVAASEEARQLIERIKKVTRRRGLHVPVPTGDHDVSDPNTVAEYLSDSLSSEQTKELETTCLGSDVHLAEVAACHQILTLLLTEPVRVPPSANQRMYKLVEAPASDPRRKPGRTIPVATVAPPAPDRPDIDDPDAALLLGMKRYSAADSWGGRLGLVGAVAAVAALLAVAVFMALPHNPPDSPAVSPARAYASAAPPAGGPGTGGPAVAPEPKPADPKKGEPKPGEPKKVEPKAGGTPDPGAGTGEVAGKGKLDHPVTPPRASRDPIGKMVTPGVVVLTRAPDPGAPWVRLDGTDNTVLGADPVVALPGFKADVKLDTGVNAHLWGNVPQFFATKPPLYDTRVRFHHPDKGFDADLTLDDGRVYLTTDREAGAKVRVRIASETWDITLPDDRSEVMVQVHTGYAPGTPYARVGGPKPQSEARLVVVRGSADFDAPGRFKKFDKLPTWSEITWSDKTGVLTDPKPVPKDDPNSIRSPQILGDQGKQVQAALSEVVKNLGDRDGARIGLKALLDRNPLPNQPPPVATHVFPTMFAAAGQASLADGPTAGDLITDLIDLARDTERPYARQGAIMALSEWIGRDPGNTAIFVEAAKKKGWPESQADLVAQLLRGYAEPKADNARAVDELVDLLNADSVVVREAALGNLISYFDPDAPRLGLLADVSDRTAPGYEKFLKAWDDRKAVIKQNLAGKK